MENNTITRKKRKRIWPIEIIAGLFIMMIVFFIAYVVVLFLFLVFADDGVLFFVGFWGCCA